MPETYQQIYEGEWTPWWKGKGQTLQCCACGLTHRIELRVRKGIIETRMYVDNRSTAATRRESGVTVTTKKPKKRTQ